jgi:hypothetical protein
VTEVTPEQVTAWEVYNLDNLYSHGLRFTLDEPEPAKAKTAKKPASEKKTTTEKKATTSKTPAKKATPSTKSTKKMAAQAKPSKPAEPTAKKPDPAEPEKPEPMEPEPRVIGTETITLMGKPVECEVVEFPTKNGRGVEAKLWISEDVPLDGVVRREEKGKVVYVLEEFGRAN